MRQMSKIQYNLAREEENKKMLLNNEKKHNKMYSNIKEPWCDIITKNSTHEISQQGI